VRSVGKKHRAPTATMVKVARQWCTPMTRTEFIKMVAGLETLDEYDERTDGDGMACDDAIETLSRLIETARELTDD
jgi:hypothetical protein